MAKRQISAVVSGDGSFEFQAYKDGKSTREIYKRASAVIPGGGYLSSGWPSGVTVNVSIYGVSAYKASDIGDNTASFKTTITAGGTIYQNSQAHNSNFTFTASGSDLAGLTRNNIYFDPKCTYNANSWPDDTSGIVYRGKLSSIYFDINIPDASVSSVNAANSKIDEDTIVSWSGSNQSKYICRIYNSKGSLIKEYTGTTSNSITIPKNTLGYGEYTAKVIVIHHPSWYSNSDYDTYSTWEETTFNKTADSGTISNLELNQTNIDTRQSKVL